MGLSDAGPLPDKIRSAHPSAENPGDRWLHSVYDQPDANSVVAQHDRVLDSLAEKLPAVVAHLQENRADVLAFTAFRKEIWKQIWSNKPPRKTQ